MYEAALNRLTNELALVEKIGGEAATEKIASLLVKVPPPAATGPASPSA